MDGSKNAMYMQAGRNRGWIQGTANEPSAARVIANPTASVMPEYAAVPAGEPFLAPASAPRLANEPAPPYIIESESAANVYVTQRNINEPGMPQMTSAPAIPHVTPKPVMPPVTPKPAMPQVTPKPVVQPVMPKPVVQPVMPKPAMPKPVMPHAMPKPVMPQVTPRPAMPQVTKKSTMPPTVSELTISSVTNEFAAPQVTNEYIISSVTNEFIMQPLPETSAPVFEQNGPDCEPLVMARVLQQKWHNVYDPEQGFSRGTLFGDLDLPFVGEGACRHG